MPAETTTLSAGARIAWTAQSRRALAQLTRLLAPYTPRRFEQAEGQLLQQQITARYQRAQSEGHLLAQTLPRWEALASALNSVLASLPQSQLSHRWILLPQDAEVRGVFDLPIDALPERAAALLRWDGNTVLLAAPSLDHGVLLDCSVEDDDRVVLTLEHWFNRDPSHGS
ncbi:hypothetical protein KAK07_02820 [Ideonella sp. 4Y16]|uniref:hypothetical protein n=1 Tax=Ideonella alba TaxID=2824118 RepID=UPI001B37DA76|nr:hypothetical protein [Ideonella alba]MBQ0942263.1 hypothetical protein [Ideonella alba]